MSKFGLLARNVLKCRVSGIYPPRQISVRSFSSDGNQQEPSVVGEEQEPAADPFLESSEGVVYGRLSGISKNTLKTDIIHFLEGCNLSTSDVKFEYNNSFAPISMMLRFPSQSSFESALRQTIRKGRLYRLDKIGSGQWDITESHDGRTILLQGIARNAFREDIERFLCGCNYDPSSFRYVSRPGAQDSVKAVAFRVATGLEAANFQIRRNRSICQNSPVTDLQKRGNENRGCPAKGVLGKISLLLDMQQMLVVTELRLLFNTECLLPACSENMEEGFDVSDFRIWHNVHTMQRMSIVSSQTCAKASRVFVSIISQLEED
ncbi:hypothetical protein HPP92_001435 [Vanilla planifolia]|uniref:Uncharacterized protein n=1 Tax=Vanilla planifolia TaxID=51239 RepID=A0A835SCP9_VANPL|nr:hypothetical protein HPP92_001435 [Vanilla planifolia]